MSTSSLESGNIKDVQLEKLRQELAKKTAYLNRLATSPRNNDTASHFSQNDTFQRLRDEIKELQKQIRHIEKQWEGNQKEQAVNIPNIHAWIEQHKDRAIKIKKKAIVLMKKADQDTELHVSQDGMKNIPVKVGDMIIKNFSPDVQAAIDMGIVDIDELAQMSNEDFDALTLDEVYTEDAYNFGSSQDAEKLEKFNDKYSPIEKYPGLYKTKEAAAISEVIPVTEEDGPLTFMSDSQKKMTVYPGGYINMYGYSIAPSSFKHFYELMEEQPQPQTNAA